MAYPGFQRGRCLRSGPIRKVGGGAVHFRSDIRKVCVCGGGGGGGGGQSTSGVCVWGGGRAQWFRMMTLGMGIMYSFYSINSFVIHCRTPILLLKEEIDIV